MKFGLDKKFIMFKNTLHAFGFCKWSKWSEEFEGSNRATPWSQREDAYIQERTCLICNKKELRVAK